MPFVPHSQEIAAYLSVLILSLSSFPSVGVFPITKSCTGDTDVGRMGMHRIALASQSFRPRLLCRSILARLLVPLFLARYSSLPRPLNILISRHHLPRAYVPLKAVTGAYDAALFINRHRLTRKSSMRTNTVLEPRGPVDRLKVAA